MIWALLTQDLKICSTGEHHKILQIYRKKRPYVLDPGITRIENLQIYMFLDHIIPNFLALQKDNITRFYKSTEKSNHMIWTLLTQELKIYISTAFWSMINQTFGLSEKITFQDSTNLQKKGTIWSGLCKQNNWKSTHLQLFGAYNTSVLGSQ